MKNISPFIAAAGIAFSACNEPQVDPTKTQRIQRTVHNAYDRIQSDCEGRQYIGYGDFASEIYDLRDLLSQNECFVQHNEPTGCVGAIHAQCDTNNGIFTEHSVGSFGVNKETYSSSFGQTEVHGTPKITCYKKAD